MKKNLSRKKSELVINEVFKDIIETLSKKRLKEQAAKQMSLNIGDNRSEMQNNNTPETQNNKTSPSARALRVASPAAEEPAQASLDLSKELNLKDSREFLKNLLESNKSKLGFRSIKFHKSQNSLIVVYPTSIDRRNLFEKVGDFLLKLQQDKEMVGVDKNLPVVQKIEEEVLTRNSIPTSKVYFKSLFYYKGAAYSTSYKGATSDFIRIRYKFDIATNEGIAFESIFAYVLSPYDGRGNKELDSSTKNLLYKLLSIDPVTTLDFELQESIQKNYPTLFKKAEEAKKQLEVPLTRDNIASVINKGGAGGITDILINLKTPVRLGSFSPVTQVHLTDRPVVGNGDTQESSTFGASLKWSKNGKENKFTSNMDLGDGVTVPKTFIIKNPDSTPRNLIPSGTQPWWVKFRIALCENIQKESVLAIYSKPANEEILRLKSISDFRAELPRDIYLAPKWMRELFKGAEEKAEKEDHLKIARELYNTTRDNLFEEILSVLFANFKTTTRTEKSDFVRKFHLGARPVPEPILKISVGTEVKIKLIDANKAKPQQAPGVEEITMKGANIDLNISGMTPARIQGVKFRSRPLFATTKSDLNIKIRGSEI
jgi:hypothetical protein